MSREPTIGRKPGERAVKSLDPAREERVIAAGRRRNWGRWGSDDEYGAANLINDAKRVSALARVEQGIVVSLSRPMTAEPNDDELFNLVRHVSHGMTETVVDYVTLPAHHATHMDALSHMSSGDGLWNGRTGEEAFAGGLTTWGDVDVWHDGFVTRGVLIDVPRFRGVPFVRREDPVTGDELFALARAHGIDPEPGDALVIYSGREAYAADNGSYYNWDDIDDRPFYQRGWFPGLDATCLEYIRDADCSIILWDMLGPHQVLWDDGIALVNGAQLDRLATVCRDLDRHDFALVCAPLRIRGGTGSPINPLALL